MPQATYSELLDDPMWKAKRANVLWLADYTCQECGAKDVPLQAHHTYYESGRLPWEYEDDVFRCLCVPCHNYFHDVKKSIDRLIGGLGCRTLERLKVIVCRMETAERMARPDRDETVDKILREVCSATRLGA